jgi:hypothetical protein
MCSGGVIPPVPVELKKARRRSPRVDVRIDGAAKSVASGVYRPPCESIGWRLFTPPYARMAPFALTGDAKLQT